MTSGHSRRGHASVNYEDVVASTLGPVVKALVESEVEKSPSNKNATRDFDI